jgi:predicted helicase
VDRENLAVGEVKWQSGQHHSAVVYNGKVAIAGIPAEACATTWIALRSGLRHRPLPVHHRHGGGHRERPNDWCDEHDCLTYIVDLIKRVTTVSVETMKIVDCLGRRTCHSLTDNRGRFYRVVPAHCCTRALWVTHTAFA